MHDRRNARGNLLAALVLLASCGCGAAFASESSERARVLMDQGNIRGATIELKNALQKDPKDADARLLLGKLHLISGNGPAAEKEIRAAIELGVDQSLWRLDLVDALIIQGRYDEALQRLDAAGDLSGADLTRSLVLRGDAALGRDQVDEARGFYDRAIEMEADNQDAAIGLLRVLVKEGDTAASIKATDAFLERFPDNVEALLIRADFMRAEGDSEKALELFDRVIAVDPRNLVGMLGRATVLIGLGELKTARDQLAQVEKIQRNVPLVSYLSGVIEFQDKNWPVAAEHLDRMLAMVPGHLQSQLLLGIIRYSQGEVETAEELLGNVVDAMPANMQAIKVLAATRIKMRNAGEAISLLEPYAQSGDPQLLALLGSAYMLDGNLEKGQEWLTKSVDSAPDVAALRTQLALTQLAGGKTDAAIDELQSAVDLGQDVLQADVLLVLAHLKNKQFDQALEAGMALEKRKADSPIAYNLTGLAYMAKGDFAGAKERFEKALAVDPAFATARINLARLDAAAKDLDGAQRRFEQVLKDDPKNMGALLGLAALAEKRDDPDALVAALGRAQDANPTVAEPGLLLARYYIIRGDYLRALTVANDLSGRFPDDDAVTQMVARAQTLGGQVENAITTFDRLLQRNPNDAKLNYLAGGARWKNRDYAGAQDAFRRALVLQPDLVDARVALASVSLDAGDTETALEAARTLQNKYPESPVGFRVEGSIYAAKRDWPMAVDALRKAYERRKSSAIVRQLAEALNKSERPTEAVEILQGWLATQPEDMQASGMLGLFLQQLGRDNEAITVYERVIERVPKRNPLLLNNLAWLYFEQGDARAKALAKEAYELEPSRPEVADTYGWILYQSGDKEQGVSILQQAYLAYPSQSEIGYHVGAALSGLGRKDEAVQILRKVLRDAPTSPQSDQIKALLKELGG